LSEDWHRLWRRIEVAGLLRHRLWLRIEVASLLKNIHQ
jgi:hypothetical protein